jgi:hypothetical protein
MGDDLDCAECDALRERISMLIEALERSSQHRDTLIGQNDRLRDDMVAIQWKASILRELVREGLRCMKEAKRRWAPTTTNSDADVWIESAEKALSPTASPPPPPPQPAR